MLHRGFASPRSSETPCLNAWWPHARCAHNSPFNGPSSWLISLKLQRALWTTCLKRLPINLETRISPSPRRDGDVGFGPSRASFAYSRAEINARRFDQADARLGTNLQFYARVAIVKKKTKKRRTKERIRLRRPGISTCTSACSSLVPRVLNVFPRDFFTRAIELVFLWGDKSGTLYCCPVNNVRAEIFTTRCTHWEKKNSGWVNETTWMDKIQTFSRLNDL